MKGDMGREIDVLHEISPSPPLIGLPFLIYRLYAALLRIDVRPT